MTTGPRSWRIALIALSAGQLGCVAHAPPVNDTEVRDVRSGEFVGPTDTLRIDLDALTLALGATEHRLTDCSTPELFCFKNEALGFHVVLPRSCARPYRNSEMAGGYAFSKIAIAEHGPARDGGYASSLSNRFFFSYVTRLGLYQVRYNPSGQPWPGPGKGLVSYRLREGSAFLRCWA